MIEGKGRGGFSFQILGEISPASDASLFGSERQEKKTPTLRDELFQSQVDLRQIAGWGIHSRSLELLGIVFLCLPEPRFAELDRYRARLEFTGHICSLLINK